MRQSAQNIPASLNAHELGRAGAAITAEAARETIARLTRERDALDAKAARLEKKIAELRKVLDE